MLQSIGVDDSQDYLIGVMYHTVTISTCWLSELLQQLLQRHDACLQRCAYIISIPVAQCLDAHQQGGHRGRAVDASSTVV